MRCCFRLKHRYANWFQIFAVFRQIATIFQNGDITIYIDPVYSTLQYTGIYRY